MTFLGAHGVAGEIKGACFRAIVCTCCQVCHKVRQFHIESSHLWKGRAEGTLGQVITAWWKACWSSMEPAITNGFDKYLFHHPACNKHLWCSTNKNFEIRKCSKEFSHTCGKACCCNANFRWSMESRTCLGAESKYGWFNKAM